MERGHAAFPGTALQSLDTAGSWVNLLAGNYRERVRPSAAALKSQILDSIKRHASKLRIRFGDFSVDSAVTNFVAAQVCAEDDFLNRCKRPVHSAGEIQECKRHLQGLALGPRNKDSRTFCYCPRLIGMLCFEVFLDSSLPMFKPAPIQSDVQLMEITVSSLPASLKKLKWPRKKQFRAAPVTLPQGYIIPKENKPARTIVGCATHALAPLHSGAAKVLGAMLADFGDSFHLENTSIFRDRVDEFNDALQHSMADDCVILNYDAVSFFLTPAHPEIMAGVEELISLAYNSVEPSNYGRKLFAHFGPSSRVSLGAVPSSSDQTRSIEVCLLVDLVRHALRHQFLRVGTVCLVQTVGVLLGSQLGPPLCGAAVARAERAWNRSLHGSKFISLSALPVCLGRYVDNRLSLIASYRGLFADAAVSLFAPDFYAPPVLFEKEPGFEALGARLSVNRSGPALMVDMSPVVVGFEEVWRSIVTFSFPPEHECILAKYQSWHSYCTYSEFRARWVGRLIGLLDVKSKGVCAVQSMAKLILVLLARFFSRPQPLSREEVREGFILMQGAVRRVARSRRDYNGACGRIIKGLSLGEAGVSAQDGVQKFLSHPVSKKQGSIHRALEANSF